MKKFIPLAVAVTLLISCGKQQTDEERKAEIDREVQQKLDAEHQAADQQKLAQDKADLDAREKALAEKEAVAANKPAVEAPAPREQRERVAREIPESRGPKSYDMFYTKLERYGDWRETSDYGYVWQPREAQSRDWRPYTNGHWVYSDAGWTWVSEEPFGWATYHYGRWTRLRGVGWVWAPGDEWAPAWVAWRTSNDYVGWAPLPPEARFDRHAGIHKWADNYYDIGPDQYSFVAQKEFGSQRVERAVVPVERNVMIVNQTTNVTNITYSNTTVVNQGPSYDEMRARSQEPIQRYRLERRSDVNEESSRAVVRGEVLEVTAPSITAEIRQRPRTSKAPILQVTVEHDWANSDRAAAQKARAKMKAEVAAPADAPSKTFVKPATTAEATAPAASSSVPASTAAATPEPTATIAQTPPMRGRASVAPVASVTPIPTATSAPKSRPSVATTPVPTASETAVVATPRPTLTPRTSEALTPPSPAPNAKRRLMPPTSVPPQSDSASPSPGASLSPAESPKQDSAQSAKPGDRPRFQSQAQKLHPRRNELMNSPSPSATGAPTSAQSPAEVTAPPAGDSKKEQKKNRKREEAPNENGPATSPTATPP